MKVLYLFFLILYHCSYAQVLDQGKLLDIEKNILAYQIKNSNSTDYDDLIPDKGYNLILKIDSIQNTFNIGNNKWKFYRITNDNFTFSNGKESTIKTFSHGIPDYYKLSKHSLIATNEKNDLLYLGGNFYESSIADQYNLSVSNPESYYPFLQIKLYHYSLERIKCIRKNKKEIIFEGFSNTLWRRIFIKIDPVNPDELIITE